MAKRKPRNRLGNTNTRGHKVAKTWINRQLWRIVEMPLQQVLPALMPHEGWYVARVTPGREQKVEDTLSESGMAVFVPRFRKRMQRQKQARELRPTLIPGYVFVGFDGSAEKQARIMGIHVTDLPRAIEWHDYSGKVFTARVRPPEVRPTCEILRNPTTGEPIEIPVSIMTRFVREVSDNAKAMPLEMVLRRGDQVKLTEGPFAGLLAIIERVDKGFADGLVEIFGAKRTVSIPVDNLEPV